MSTRIGVGALVMAALALASGCKTGDCLSETCQTVVVYDSPRTGAFTFTPSIEAAFYTGDLVVDTNGQPVLEDDHYIYTRLAESGPVQTSIANECARISGPCVKVDTRRGVTVLFALPTAPGTYRLEELGAYATESVGTLVTAVRGGLIVRAATPGCGEGACGRLDADVLIDAPPALEDGPSIHGSGRIACAETTQESCHTPACIEPDLRGAWPSP